METIETTAEIGFSAIELACKKPHFDIETAFKNSKKIAEHIHKTGLKVSALSLFNNFTDKTCLNDQIEEAKNYIRFGSGGYA